MEEEEDVGAQVHVPKPFSRLALCNRSLRKAFQECVSVEVKATVKELDARGQEYTRLEHELRGFMYLAPNQKLRGRLYLACGPNKFVVEANLTVKVTQGDGSYVEKCLCIAMKKVGERWKLQRSSSLPLRGMEITVKRAGSDEWTPVDLYSTVNGVLNTCGTNFDSGDQLNLRIVRSSGRSDPVSFDGTEETNCFPLTICVIG